MFICCAPHTGNYGPTSPCLQRGRFAVIPEEPHSSGGPAPVPATSNAPSALKNAHRSPSPSPDWDFDTDVSIYNL